MEKYTPLKQKQKPKQQQQNQQPCTCYYIYIVKLMEEQHKAQIDT